MLPLGWWAVRTPIPQRNIPAFKKKMYKLTGNKIPHPFLTYSLFLSCDICIKHMYINKRTASGQKGLAWVQWEFPQPPKMSGMSKCHSGISTVGNFQFWGVWE